MTSLNDRLLLGPKLLYSSMSMIYYGFYQYRTNYASEVLGFDTAQYGYMYGTMAAVAFLTMAGWGWLTDWSKNPKAVLTVVSIGTASSFSLFLIPSFRGFAVSMVNLGVYAAFCSGFQALCDDQVLRILSKTSSKDLYGKQRLWETISFSFTTMILGFLVKRFTVFAIHIWVPIAAIIFIIVVCCYGTNDEEVKTESELPDVKIHKSIAIEETSSTTNLLEPTKRPIFVLLCNPQYLFFLFGVFLTGCARAVMSAFLSRYLQQDMHLDPVQTSNAAISGVILEIIIFFGSAFYLQNVGIYWMLILAQLAMMIRSWVYVGLSPVPSNWWAVYLVELLKGVGFGFTQTAGVRLANEMVPPGLESTSQSLYTGMYSQLPAVLVAFVGGQVYQDYGPRSMFLGTAVMTTASLILFVIKYTYDGRLSKLPV